MDKEQIVIVDEDDNPIGYKNRDELDYSKDIYRVAGLWLTNSKDEILLAQRSMKKKINPGLWAIAVAGTVDRDESYKENITREAKEEIGLSGVQFELGPKLFIEGKRRYFGQFFLAKLDKDADDFILQKEEVEQVKWISPQELVEDVKVNPDKYVSSMPKVLEAFNL